jgi:hypothetical protein
MEEPANAGAHLLPEAGAQRTLEAVRCSAVLGAGNGRDTVHTCLLHRPLPLYPFNSCFSSLKKRQSVCWAMSFWGVDLIKPASCRRRA